MPEIRNFKMKTWLQKASAEITERESYGFGALLIELRRFVTRVQRLTGVALRHSRKFGNIWYDIVC